MRLLPQAGESAPAAGSQRARSGPGWQYLVLCCYLLGAVAVTWRLWADPAGRVQGTGDIDQFAWFMRYSANAVAHGHLPALTTTALNAPYGVNLMWNTSFLLPGVVLAPVTLLAGPQVSLTLMLTAGFAGSAAAMFGVLRRWGAGIAAAALGGAVYGFSPALVHAGIGGYQLQFMVLPPLMISALLRIVTGRGSPVRAGVWLGLLAAAQLFIAEEVLAGTALAGVTGVAVLAAGQPRAVPRRARAALAGLATAAGVALLLCARALWVQFQGPGMTNSGFRTSLPAFVTPSGSVLFHTGASAEAITRTPAQGAALMYLGWPLLVVAIAAVASSWRRPEARVTGAMFAVLALLSLSSNVVLPGGSRYAGPLLPWYWLQGLPVLRAVLPYRLAILTAGAAGALLAFWPGAARELLPRAANWRRVIAWAVPAAAVLAVLPLIPLPFGAIGVTRLPAGYQTAFTRLRLPPGARVLVVPVPDFLIPQPMRWQADTGQPASMIGGDFIGFSSSGQVVRGGLAGQTATTGYLNALWTGSPPGHPPSPAQVHADFAAWRPAAVVADTVPGSRLARYLTGLLGPPTCQAGSVLGWRLS